MPQHSAYAAHELRHHQTRRYFVRDLADLPCEDEDEDDPDTGDRAYYAHVERESVQLTDVFWGVYVRHRDHLRRDEHEGRAYECASDHGTGNLKALIQTGNGQSEDRKLG